MTSGCIFTLFDVGNLLVMPSVQIVGSTKGVTAVGTSNLRMFDGRNKATATSILKCVEPWGPSTICCICRLKDHTAR